MQIVCLSSSNWYPYPTSKQEIMRRMDADVLYFDPPVTFLAPLRDRAARSRLTAYRHEQEKPQENITVCALPPVLPFGNRFRILNRINQAFLAGFVRRKMRAYGFGDDSILWMYLPGHCDIVRKIPARARVYTCVDRHSGYKGQINPALVDGMEAALAKECDAVFATAQGLYDTLVRVNPNTTLIPNGVNYELFARAQEELPVSEELRDIEGPVLGFIGALQECIDYPLLRRLAQMRPDCTLVLIGREHPDAAIDEIRGLPNVRILGLKAQSKLPAYLARFDVCLNPFRSGSLSRDVSPLKFYEYLATGKPVVSTPEPVQVRDFADAVYIADGADAFIGQVRVALERDTPEKRKRRIAYARACSWDARAARFTEVLEQCLRKKE
ncbi:MAG: glycosyltransferase [Clostridiaceae bacterium]|nr:glycosyltransferase [Clostridiaceae bacterium]